MRSYIFGVAPTTALEQIALLCNVNVSGLETHSSYRYPPQSIKQASHLVQILRLHKGRQVAIVIIKTGGAGCNFNPFLL